MSEPEAQVDVDENGEPLPDAQEKAPQQKKLEEDPLFNKAVELLGSKA
jgi:hypothetical protein